MFYSLQYLLKLFDFTDEEKAVDELYHSIIVTEEYLMDCNKYWCEKCSRYNEAKRCVKFEKLPRLLTLHLKRFSSGFGLVFCSFTLSWIRVLHSSHLLKLLSLFMARHYAKYLILNSNFLTSKLIQSATNHTKFFYI